MLISLCGHISRAIPEVNSRFTDGSCITIETRRVSLRRFLKNVAQRPRERTNQYCVTATTVEEFKDHRINICGSDKQ